MGNQSVINNTNTNNIDQLNYYDPLIRGKNDKMSEVWIANMSAFIQTLQSYLSQFGIFVPQVSTAQQMKIQQPVNGQIVYNTDTNQFQGWKVNAWVVIA